MQIKQARDAGELHIVVHRTAGGCSEAAVWPLLYMYISNCYLIRCIAAMKIIKVMAIRFITVIYNDIGV